VQGTGPDLRDDVRILSLCLQDLLPAKEIDIGDLARTDILRRSNV
jgi:hypothetical protein